ncbi:MAG: hypothetical protein V1918_03025 [Planctomycetota bacterium]
MKIKLIQAARSLGVHPAFLLLYISELDELLQYQDVWPEVDDGIIKTIQVSMLKKPYVKKSVDETAFKQENKETVIESNLKKIIVKLSNKKWWGKSTCLVETLQKITRIEPKELNAAVEEGVRRQFLLVPEKGSHKTYSLNPNKNREIEKLIE